MAWLDDYESVDERLAKWWADHPDGRIVTRIDRDTGDDWIVEAAVYNDQTAPSPRATGHARNPANAQGKGAQATHPLEDAETSAIGRALANAGYSTKGGRPSREEMAQAEDRQPQPQPEPEPDAEIDELLVQLTSYGYEINAAQVYEWAGKSPEHREAALQSLRDRLPQQMAEGGEAAPFDPITDEQMKNLLHVVSQLPEPENEQTRVLQETDCGELAELSAQQADAHVDRLTKRLAEKQAQEAAKESASA